MFTTHARQRKYLLLLKADEFLRDRAIVAAHRCYGGMVVGMATAPQLAPNRHLDHVLVGDPHRPASVLQAVRAFEQSHGCTPEAVIPLTEMTLRSALQVAEAYALPFLARSTVEAARDKCLMKEAFIRGGVTTPRHKQFRSLDELRAAVHELGLPVVVKPVDAAHSIGIRRIDSERELEAGYAYCRAGLQDVAESWGIGVERFQVEQYIEAEREFSVEVVNFAGEHHVVAITDKSLTPPPYFAETGHMVPSTHTHDIALRNEAVAACRALQITHGVSHVEIRLDARGRAYVIEVAARPGGDGIMDLVERAYGMNMYALHIRSYLGTLRSEDVVGRAARGTAAIAFMPSVSGRVQRIELPTSLPPEVVSVYLSARVGEQKHGSLCYDDRLGTVEFFWPVVDAGLHGRHLELVETLRDQVFTIGD